MPTSPAFLKKTPLFASLSEAHLRKIAALGESKTYAAGTTIFEEGSPGDEFYIVEGGVVEISKNIAGGRRKLLARAGVGEVFGELTIFDDQTRSAAALADGECRLLVFHVHKLQELLTSEPDLSFAFFTALLRLVYQRLRASNEKLKEGVVWGFQTRS